MSEDTMEQSDIKVDAGQQEEVGAQEGQWYSNLENDLRSHPSITKYKDVGALAKDYINLEKTIGKEKVVLPTDKSTPEEIEQFYEKLGRPESFDKYDAPELEIENEELRMQEHTLEAFKKKAHELGLNNKQFAELYALQHELTIDRYNNALEQQVQARASGEAELRKEWGDSYDVNVDRSQKVLNQYFKGLGDNQAFQNLANNPAFIKGLANIADQVGEDAIVGGARMTLSPSEAQRKVDSIIGDKSHPYHNDLHPEHNAAVEEFISLQTAALSGQ